MNQNAVYVAFWLCIAVIGYGITGCLSDSIESQEMTKRIEHAVCKGDKS